MAWDLPVYSKLITWTTDDVCSWLKKIQVSDVIPKFKTMRIDGQQLSNITESKIFQSGVSMKSRRKILEYVANIKGKNAPNNKKQPASRASLVDFVNGSINRIVGERRQPPAAPIRDYNETANSSDDDAPWIDDWSDGEEDEVSNENAFYTQQQEKYIEALPDGNEAYLDPGDQHLTPPTRPARKTQSTRRPAPTPERNSSAENYEEIDHTETNEDYELPDNIEGQDEDYIEPEPVEDYLEPDTSTHFDFNDARPVSRPHVSPTVTTRSPKIDTSSTPVVPPARPSRHTLSNIQNTPTPPIPTHRKTSDPTTLSYRPPPSVNVIGSPPSLSNNTSRKLPTSPAKIPPAPTTSAPPLKRGPSNANRKPPSPPASLPVSPRTLNGSSDNRPYSDKKQELKSPSQHFASPVRKRSVPIMPVPSPPSDSGGSYKDLKPGGHSPMRQPSPKSRQSSQNIATPRTNQSCSPFDDMSHESWFHGNISRDQAINVLNTHRTDGMYLVRGRPAEANIPYAVSIYFKKTFNLLIRKLPNSKFALGKEKKDEITFSSPTKLINYYQTNKILLDNTEDGTQLTIAAPKS